MNILIRSRQNSQHVSNSLPLVPIYQVIKYSFKLNCNDSQQTSHSPPLLSHTPTPYDCAFPFKEIALNRMHRQIVSTIRGPHFFFGLPNLSYASWNLIIENTTERERLEFLGDALIGSAVSEQLCRYWPNECPRFYTVRKLQLIQVLDILLICFHSVGTQHPNMQCDICASYVEGRT